MLTVNEVHKKSRNRNRDREPRGWHRSRTHEGEGDTGDALKLGAIGLSGDVETLQLLEDTIRGARAAMRLAVQEKQPELVSVLRKFNVSRSDDSITVSGYVPAQSFRELSRKTHLK